MKISETFGSAYLAASDLPQPVKVTITGAVAHTFPNDTKPKLVVSLAEFEKQLVCNKINREAIVAQHGDDSALWVGKQIVLYATTTEFSGKIVPCVRVRPVQHQPQQQVQQVPAETQQPTPAAANAYSEPINPAQQTGPAPPSNGEVPWA